MLRYENTHLTNAKCKHNGNKLKGPNSEEASEHQIQISGDNMQKFVVASLFWIKNESWAVNFGKLFINENEKLSDFHLE